MSSLITAAVCLSLGIEPLVSRLEGIEYLTGTFLQHDYWALTLDTEESHGTLHLSNPNLFLLEYEDGSGRMTGSTGSEVFTVDPDFAEILVYSGSATGFLHILTGAVEEGGAVSGSIEGDSVTVVLRGTFDGGIVEITAGYSTADSLPFLLSTVDTNGNTSTWHLRNLRTGTPLPNVFRLPDIPGYTLVDAGDVN